MTSFECRARCSRSALGVLTAIVVTDGLAELQHPIFPEALTAQRVRELARCRIPVEVKDEQLVRHPLPCVAQ